MHSNKSITGSKTKYRSISLHCNNFMFLDWLVLFCIVIVLKSNIVMISGLLDAYMCLNTLI